MGLLTLDLLIRSTAAMPALLKVLAIWHSFRPKIGHRSILNLVKNELRVVEMPTERMSRRRIVESIEHSVRKA